MSMIRTATVRYLDLTGSTPDDIDPLDLARGLSRACRFAGQTTAFYSVAQHSVLASYYVPPDDALHALLHDAAEAYLGDLTSPLKRLMVSYHEALLTSAAEVAGMESTRFIELLTQRLPKNWTVPNSPLFMGVHAKRPFYHQLEQHLFGLIAERFGISATLPDSVKTVDARLMFTERLILMPGDYEPWYGQQGIDPLPIWIDPWSAEVAEQQFLQRLADLTAPPPAAGSLMRQPIQNVDRMVAGQEDCA